MGAAIQQRNQTKTWTPPTQKVTPPKKERTAEEKEDLKRQFLLGFNSYHVGSTKDVTFDKLHNHVFQGDGDYVVVNNRIGNFIVKTSNAERPGLPVEYGGTSIKLKVPKIPKKIYYQIRAFFRDIMGEMGNSEAFIQVYYDQTDKKYVCNVPEQEVSGAAVKYDATKNLDVIDRDRYIFVFEIHSHNTMGAFWSGTDNADEKETRFYGVFGELNKEQHAEKFRFMVMGKQVDCKAEHIFDMGKNSDEVTSEQLTALLRNKTGEVFKITDLVSEIKGEVNTYPKEWKDNVKKRVYTGGTNSYIGGKQQNYGRNWDGGNYSTPQADGGYPGMEDDPWYNDMFDKYDPEYKKKEAKAQEMNLSKPPTPGSAEDRAVEEFVDIDDTFDLGNYEPDIQPIIVETFAGSLDEMSASYMIECMVDQGFDSVIQNFKR